MAYAKANATNDGQKLIGGFRRCRSLSLIARVKLLDQSVVRWASLTKWLPQSGKVEIDLCSVTVVDQTAGVSALKGGERDLKVLLTF